MQGDAEAVELDRHDAEQGGGKEAFENIQHTAFDVCPSALILNGHVKNRHHRARGEEGPGEEGKQADEGLDPGQVEDLRSQLAHHGEKVRDGVIDDPVDPVQKGVEDCRGNGVADAAEDAADGVADPLHQIYQPVKNRSHLLKCGGRRRIEAAAAMGEGRAWPTGSSRCTAARSG